jgi:hypothetical protein
VKLPSISERTANRIGLAVVVVTAPVLVPALAAIAALCGLVLAKRWAIGPSKNWRPWFAWYPVNVGDVFGPDWRWLEIVERQSWAMLNDTSFRANDLGIKETGR